MSVDRRFKHEMSLAELTIYMQNTRWEEVILTPECEGGSPSHPREMTEHLKEDTLHSVH